MNTPSSTEPSPGADTEPPELPTASIESVTELIEAAQSGRESAWNEVYNQLYAELHEAARQRIWRWWRHGERSPTSLINRAWLRFDQTRLTLQSRQHLLAVLSRAMRYALLDEARQLNVRERHLEALAADAADGSATALPLDELLALDRALDALSAVDERLGQLAEMRYFAGMNNVEIAQAMGLTDRTVRRDWRRARAFLALQMDIVPAAADGDD